MELFKYRSLSLGCGCFLVALIVSFYIDTAIRMAILILLGIAIVILASIVLLKSNEISKNILLRVFPAFILVCLAVFLSVSVFDKDKQYLSLCDGEEHTVRAVITDVTYTSDFMGIYTVELLSVDGEDEKFTSKLTCYGKGLERFDIISAKGVFTTPERAKIGFDYSSYSLSLGILLEIESSEYTVIGKRSSPILSQLSSANDYLDSRLALVGDEDTHAMLSALFLGNKDLLDKDVERDFTRVGLSHIIALSGMHITIIITIIGLFIDRLELRNTIKSLLLSLTILAFVGMTGFSDSAMRAGLMVIVTFTISIFGRQLDTITALFLSVVILCIISPYNIFSVSLILSFFAMLGCVMSSKAIRRMKHYRHIKIKVIRYIAYDLISSAFSITSTLPYICLVFGSVPVLAIVVNLLLSPMFSLLIYLSPIFIVASYIPFVDRLFAYICTELYRAVIYICRLFSSLDGIVIPIKSIIQTVGIVIIGVFVFLLFTSRREFFKKMLCGVLAGITVLSIGSGILLFNRENSTYVTAYSSKSFDIIALETEGDVTVFDVTNTLSGSYDYAYDVSRHLGYYEIEKYCIVELSSQTHLCFDRLSDSTIINSVYLPEPLTDSEEAVYGEIAKIAEEKKIEFYSLKEKMRVGETNITLQRDFSLTRSSRCSPMICIEENGVKLVYAGASAFELESPIIEESLITADIAVFGSYGPAYKKQFYFDLPQASRCMYLGKSKDFATEEMILQTQSVTIDYEGYPVRFKLSP
ncbi:MAG: ComEC/Rec2 family competence protein [Clostridia bacterium]|nr:ComEC/Rec2 family competence protein [Clostridia bacterium]